MNIHKSLKILTLNCLTLLICLITFNAKAQEKSMPKQSDDYFKTELLKIDSLIDIHQIQTAKQLAIRLEMESKASGKLGYYFNAFIKHIELIKLTEEYDFENSFILKHCNSEIAGTKGEFRALAHLLTAKTYLECGLEGFYINDTAGNKNTISTDSVFKAINNHLDSALALSKNIPFREDFLPYYQSTDTLEFDFKLSLNAMFAEFAANLYLSIYQYGQQNIEYKSVRFDTLMLFSERQVFQTINFNTVQLDSSLRNCMKMFQILMKESPVYHDIQRLQFLYENFAGEQRYLKALRQIIDTNPKNELIVFAYENLVSIEMNSDKVKALNTAKEGIAKFPESKYIPILKSQVYHIVKKRVGMITETNYQPVKSSKINGKMLVHMTLKNCDSLYFRIYKVNYVDYFLKMREVKKVYIGPSERLQELIDEKAVLACEYSCSVFNPMDYESHTYDMVIPGLKKGTYIIMAGTGKNFDDTSDITASLVHVSDIFAVKDNNDYYMLSAEEGKPLANTMFNLIFVNADNGTEKHEIKTDNNGKLNLDKYLHSNKDALILSKDGSFSINIYLHHYWRENTYKMLKSSEILLDRKLYRPGQTVYFKAIIYDTSNKVVPEQELQVTLSLDYQTKEYLNLKSNRYGSVSGSFTLPKNGVSGKRASINISMNNMPIAAESFYIEEYKLPKFNVAIEYPDTSYKLGDTVSVKVKAMALAAYPVSNSKVSYHVNRYASYYRIRSGSSDIIASGEGLTNDKGEFMIRFPALPDSMILKNFQNYYFEVVVDVLDLNGELKSSSKIFNIGFKDKYLDLIDVLESINENQTIVNYTFKSLQGKPMPFSGKLEVYKLEPETDSYRPLRWSNCEYNTLSDKDKLLFRHYKMSETKRIMSIKLTEEIKDDHSNVIRIDNNKLEPGYSYVFKLISNDGDTSEMTYSGIRMKEKLNEKRFKVIEAYAVDGAIYEHGQTVRFAIRSQFKNQNVHVVIESKDEVLYNDNIHLKNGFKLIKIPLTSEKISQLRISVFCVRSSAFFEDNYMIYIKPKNKDFKISYKSFRSDLEPGRKEKWSFTLSAPSTSPNDIELASTMYDAALDLLGPQVTWQIQRQFPYMEYRWTRGLQSMYYGISIRTNEFHYNRSLLLNYPRIFSDLYFSSDYFNSTTYFSTGTRSFNNKRYRLYDVSDNMGYKDAAVAKFGDSDSDGDGVDSEIDRSEPTPEITIRKNFNETAFFMPHIYPDKDSIVHLEFEMPESITKWRFMLLGHDLDMNTGYLESEVTTSKKLMVQPNLPRFLRIDDVIDIPAKIVNTLDKEMDVKVTFRMLDAETNAPLYWLLGDSVTTIKLKGNQSEKVHFKIKVPNYNGLTSIVLIADGGLFGDGELRILPVLSNKTLVQSSLPITVRKAGTRQIDFKALKNNTSSTLETKLLAVEMSEKPYWNALLSLPYLMEYPNECSEQIFSRLFAYNLAYDMLQKDSLFLKQVQKWNEADENPFDEKLDRNQDLKTVLISETPWALEAKNEKLRMQRLSKLFNAEFLSDKMEETFIKLLELQNTDGSFSWYKGMQSNEYITQTIVIGLGKLIELGSPQSLNYEQMSNDAIKWLNMKARKDQSEYKSNKKLNWKPINLSYLYAKSFFFEPETEKPDSLILYYLNNAEKVWMKLNLMSMAHLAIAIHRFNPDSKVPGLIIRAFDENAKISDEMGMYWPKNINGYYWHQSSINTHAAIMEAYAIVNGEDKRLEDMQVWLLRHKQTHAWSDTRTTADACYALLNYGMADNVNQEISINFNNKIINPPTQEKTGGYWRVDIEPESVKSGNANISVSAKTDGFAYGAIHWQYLEDVSKVRANGSGMTINRKYFVERIVNGKKINVDIKNGDSLLIGEIVHVTLYVSSDRELEYVHLKDQRASCAEPRDVLSAYKWGDNIGYYQNVTDATMNFFIEYVPKGRFEITYDVSVQQSGKFECGIASIQCLYAPEFTANSEGHLIIVR